MSKTRWGGADALAARASLAPLVNSGGAICCRCRRPIAPDPRLRGDGWQPDHWPIPREHGGREVQPAHAHCNMSAGGKRGAQITNARRGQKRTAHNRARNIRGI